MQGHADLSSLPSGRDSVAPHLLPQSGARNVEQTGGRLDGAFGAVERLQDVPPFRAAADGETVTGTFTGTMQLSNGKFAIVEKSHEFTLVQWRPVIDRQLGREVSDIVRGGAVSWQLGVNEGLAYKKSRLLTATRTMRPARRHCATNDVQDRRRAVCARPERREREVSKTAGRRRQGLDHVHRGQGLSGRRSEQGLFHG